MRDMDKQPSATSASTHSHSDSADVALKHIVDGFVHFRKEVFPQQEELFKKLLPRNRREPCSLPARIRASFPS